MLGWKIYNSNGADNSFWLRPERQHTPWCSPGFPVPFHTWPPALRLRRCTSNAGRPRWLPQLLLSLPETLSGWAAWRTVPSVFQFWGNLNFHVFSGVEEPQKNKSQSWHTLFAGVLIALKNALFTRVYKNQVDNVMGLFTTTVKKPAKAWILCTPHPHLPWRMPSCAEEAPPRQTIKKEKDLRICKQSRGYGNI